MKNFALEENNKYLLKDFRHAHSEFQIDNFIIGTQVTDWGKYQQCLREIVSRSETIENLLEELQKSEIEIEMLERSICLRRSSRNLRRLKIERVLRRIEKNRINLSESQREMNRFISLAEELKKKLGEIDEERRSQLDYEMWFEIAIQKIKLELRWTGRLSMKTVEFVLSLPKDIIREIESSSANLKLINCKKKEI